MKSRTPDTVISSGGNALAYLAAGILLAFPSPAFADNTWDGGGTSGDWNDRFNWGSDTLPAGASLTFAGTSQLITNNNQYAVNASVTPSFAAGAGAFELNGNAITLGGNIANNSSNTQTINLNMLLGASRTITGGAGVVLGGSVTGNGTRTITNSLTAGTVTISGPLYISDAETAGRVFSISGTGNTLISGTISNNNFGNTVSGAFAKGGAGTLTVTGQNTYTGVTTVSAGTLAIGSSSTPGTANATVTSGPVGTGTLYLNSGTVQSSGGAQTVSNPVSIVANSTVGDGGSALTFNGLVGTDAAAGRTLTVNNSGLTTFGGGIQIRLDASLGARALTIAGTGNVLISSAITSGNSNQADMNYTGSGTVTASGNNSYNGNTTVGAGKTLKIGSSTGLGWGGRGLNIAGVTTVSSGGVLDLDGQSTVNEPITINGTGISSGGALINSNTGAAATIGNGIAVLTTPGGGTGWTTASVSITGGGSGATGAATITAGAITGITITGAGTGYTSAPTVTITGDGTAVTAAGVLSSVALGSASSIGGAGDINIDAIVAGAFPLTKVGDGKVTLSGANAYSGGTVLSGGTLQAENSAALGTTAGATLNGGTLKLGGSPTLTLNLPAMTWDNTATLSFDLGSSNASDTIALTGILTQGAGGSNFAFNFNGTGLLDSTYTLLTFASSTFVSESAFVAANNAVNGHFVLGPTSLVFVTVPEPAHYSTALAGILGIIIFLRNRRGRH